LAIVFGTSGNCVFLSFSFVDSKGNNYTPPGFTGPTPANGAGATVSYDYDYSGLDHFQLRFAWSTRCDYGATAIDQSVAAMRFSRR
jgi:hypothetical protein